MTLAEFCRIHPLASTIQNLATWIVSNVDGSFEQTGCKKAEFYGSGGRRLFLTSPPLAEEQLVRVQVLGNYCR